MPLSFHRLQNFLGKSTQKNENSETHHKHNGLIHKLNSIDVYGRRIQFNVDGCSGSVTTPFGGLVTLLFVFLMTVYTGQHLRIMLTRSETLFITSTQILDIDQQMVRKIKDKHDMEEHEHKDGEAHKGTVSMSEFDDSFNMIIGSTDTEINLLNNRFINIKVYEIDQEWAPKPSENIHLKQCQDDDLRKFIKDRALGYYPNSLCFEDKSEIALHSNWYNDVFQNILIVGEQCQNTTENNNWCATKDEIDAFSKKTIFYLVRQETLVDKEIYYDQARDFKNEETGEYFPLKINTRSMFYQTFKPNHDIDLVEMLEFELTINKIDIDDSMLQIGISERSKQFINFRGQRFIQDKRSFYQYEGSQPIFICYFGIFNNATSYKRIDYTLLDLLGDVGGLMDALLVIFSMLVFYFCDININCTVLKLFEFLLKKEEENPFKEAVTVHHKDHPKVDPDVDNPDQEMFEGGKKQARRFSRRLSTMLKGNQFQSFKFQFKLFVYKRICCSNRLAKKLFYKDISFGYNEGLYCAYTSQISKMLSMTKVMKENLKSEKINALNEAKEMLQFVKQYYSEKIVYIKSKSKSKRQSSKLNAEKDIVSNPVSAEFESQQFSSESDSSDNELDDKLELGVDVKKNSENREWFRQKTEKLRDKKNTFKSQKSISPELPIDRMQTISPLQYSQNVPDKPLSDDFKVVHDSYEKNQAIDNIGVIQSRPADNFSPMCFLPEITMRPNNKKIIDFHNNPIEESPRQVEVTILKTLPEEHFDTGTKIVTIDPNSTNMDPNVYDSSDQMLISQNPWLKKFKVHDMSATKKSQSIQEASSLGENELQNKAWNFKKY